MLKISLECINFRRHILENICFPIRKHSITLHENKKKQEIQCVKMAKSALQTRLNLAVIWYAKHKPDCHLFERKKPALTLRDRSIGERRGRTNVKMGGGQVCSCKAFRHAGRRSHNVMSHWNLFIRMSVNKMTELVAQLCGLENWVETWLILRLKEHSGK